MKGQPETWIARLPASRWLSRYDRRTFENDAIAAVIVTLMLVPQSMAYAILAGMPPQTGLYASMLPLIAYAVAWAFLEKFGGDSLAEVRRNYEGYVRSLDA